MAKISSQLAVEKIGNRYDMILVASRRARELQLGDNPKIDTDTGHVLTALTEIEQGLVGREYLKRRF